MKNVLVVVNFEAGRKKALKYRKKLQKFLLKNSNTFKFIDIDELSNIELGYFDTIIAMGGDGTVNKVLPLIIANDLTLGIVPCGTANLLAAKLGISANINNAIKVLQMQRVSCIDVLKINDKDCVLRLGMGFDSDIICKTPQSLKNKFGYFAYFIAGILFALRLKRREYKITYDEKIIEENASCVIVANAANMYKNYFSVGKNSRLDDNLFEVFILKTKNPINFFIEIIKGCLGIYKNSRSALYIKTNNLKLENTWINAHVDGEKNIFKENIEITISERKIKVLN